MHIFMCMKDIFLSCCCCCCSCHCFCPSFVPFITHMATLFPMKSCFSPFVKLVRYRTFLIDLSLSQMRFESRHRFLMQGKSSANWADAAVRNLTHVHGNLLIDLLLVKPDIVIIPGFYPICTSAWHLILTKNKFTINIILSDEN